MDELTTKAIQVLDNTKARVDGGEWVQDFFRVANRSCLHTILGDEIRKVSKSGYPTPLDGKVFHAVWDALPPWANRHIPEFNDHWDTKKADVLGLLDTVIRSLRSCS
jgi:hypothetical protein